MTAGHVTGKAPALRLRAGLTAALITLAVAATAVAGPAAAVQRTNSIPLLPGPVDTGVAITATTATVGSADFLVLPGLTPELVTGEFLPATSAAGDDVVPGTVEVYSGPRLLVRQTAGTTTFRAPLSSADVDEDILNLTVKYTVPELSDDLCESINQSITLSNIAISYAGNQTRPDSVAEFLAPGAAAVNVVLPGPPQGPTDPIVQAGLTAVAALQYRYGASVPILMSFGQPDPRVLAVDGGRIVAITGGTNPTTTSISDESGVPQLNIVGTGPEITAAASALGSDKIPLAGAADTTGLAQSGSPLTNLTLSLADLGNPRPRISGWDGITFDMGIKQSAFRGPISDVSVRLVGTHSAIPPAVSATVNVYWNGFLVASQVLNDQVPFDLTASVPNSALRPDNGLQVLFTAVPSGGECGGSLLRIPMELFIDGEASLIEAGRGQTLGTGFQRFPQTLGGSLPIAFGDGASLQDAAIDASLLAASLQNSNADQLDISLVPLADIVNSTVSGLVTGASTQNSDDLSAPLRLTEFRTVQSAVVDFGVGVTVPYAALEAFSQNGRNLLMLGAWSPTREQAAEAQATARGLATFTYATPGGWSSLGGDLLLGQPGTEPIPLTTNAVAAQESVTDDYRPWALWALIAFLILLGVGLLRMFLARRSRRKLKTYVDAQETADREKTESALASTDDA